MARLHSDKKGKSGTKRPKDKTAPEWTDKEKKDVEEMVVKMAKEGIPPAKIGLAMRDTHGIANLRAILGMSLVRFLKKEKVAPEIPGDLLDLIKKAVRMNSHVKGTRNDTHNEVKLGHVESKIQRLVKYYKSKGTLPGSWKYDRENAALLVK